MGEPGFVEVTALIDKEPSLPGDRADVLGWLQRLCRVAARDLDASGVGVSVMSEGGDQLSTAASGPEHELVEELQFVTGEGPCIDAFTSRRPVLAPDLAAAARRWPGYAPAAQGHGVRAVFAFPMQVGAARLGAIDVYRETVGDLSKPAVARAVTFCEAALWSLLDAQGAAEVGRADSAATRRRDLRGMSSTALHGAQEDRLEVYQAQGMISIQLGVPIAEASSRLRAYAYAHERRVSDVARDVVARRLQFEVDDPQP